MNKNLAIKILFLSFICNLVPAQSVEDSKPAKADKEEQLGRAEYKVKQSYEKRFTKWMPNDAFSDFYINKHEEKYFPVVLEGRLISEQVDGHIKGDWEYRAIFEKIPVSSFFTTLSGVVDQINILNLLKNIKTVVMKFFFPRVSKMLTKMM